MGRLPIWNGRQLERYVSVREMTVADLGVIKWLDRNQGQNLA